MGYANTCSPYGESYIRENTLFGSKFKFPLIVWTEMGPTSTAKNFKEGVIWGFTQKAFKRSLHRNDTARKTINKKAGRGKGITPKPKGNRGMCKES